MTVEFKVGDRVRRIRDNFAGIKVGDIGTIEEIKDSGFGGRTLVLKEYNFKNGFTYDNFELVEAAFTPTFKAGDRVVGVKEGSGVSEGVEYTVARDSYKSDRGEEVVELRELQVGRFVFAFRVQHIEEETVTETFDTYDERMLPLFAKAAEEAESRGYCAEYDGIAAVIGAPSREEIRRLTAPVKTPKELAQEAFDAIPVGYTFHFLDDRSKRHVKLSETAYIFDRNGFYSKPYDIKSWLKYGIEAN